MRPSIFEDSAYSSAKFWRNTVMPLVSDTAKKVTADDEQLHQLAFRAVQRDRETTAAAADLLADRHHLIHRRHIAKRQHGRRRFSLPHIWRIVDRDTSPEPAARATLFGNTGLDLLEAVVIRQIRPQRKPSCAKYRSTVGGSPFAKGTAGVASQSLAVSRGGASRCRRAAPVKWTSSMSRPAWAAMRRATSPMVNSSVVPM